MKELELNTKEGYVNLPYEIMFEEGLSTQAKLIYCYIRKFSAQNKKCFVSNAFLQKLTSNRKGPMSSSQVNGYLQELENQKLITRGQQNNRRILYAYDWSEREYNHRQNTDCHKVDCLPIESIPSTDRQNTVYTIESRLSRYNTVQNTEKNTVDIPKEPFLVDDKNNLDMKKNDKEFQLFMRKHILQNGWKANTGWKELLCNLSKDEVKELETYLETNRFQDRDYRPTIDEVIENRLYVTQ